MNKRGCYKDGRKSNGKHYCIVCRKYKTWESLILVEYIPDSEFSKESMTYACKECLRKQSKQNDSLS